MISSGLSRMVLVFCVVSSPFSKAGCVKKSSPQATVSASAFDDFPELPISPEKISETDLDPGQRQLFLDQIQRHEGPALAILDTTDFVQSSGLIDLVLKWEEKKELHNNNAKTAFELNKETGRFELHYLGDFEAEAEIIANIESFNNGLLKLSELAESELRLRVASTYLVRVNEGNTADNSWHLDLMGSVDEPLVFRAVMNIPAGLSEDSTEIEGKTKDYVLPLGMTALFSATGRFNSNAVTSPYFPRHRAPPDAKGARYFLQTDIKKRPYGQ